MLTHGYGVGARALLHTVATAVTAGEPLSGAAPWVSRVGEQHRKFAGPAGGALQRT